MSEIALELANIEKKYADVRAVRDFSIHLESGKILALVGPSGCGKTTVLRLIAGFEKADRGTIRLGKKTVLSDKHFVPPENRGVGLVFQDYALFPHLSVRDNVAFGLNNKIIGAIREQAESNINLVGLANKGDRFPHELSGGERQRVALARALAPRPILVLLDEPFSNLDADRRLRMREEVRVILKSTKATAVFVTHDQEEALYMGDSLAVMNSGALEQIGSPEEIFHQPSTRFVAEFMGNTDFLPGVVSGNGISTDVGEIAQKVSAPNGSKVEIALRADDVDFLPRKGSQTLILARHFRGPSNFYRLRLPSGHLLHASKGHEEIYSPGTPVDVKISAGHNLACFLDGKNVSKY